MKEDVKHSRGTDSASSEYSFPSHLKNSFCLFKGSIRRVKLLEQMSTNFFTATEIFRNCTAIWCRMFCPDTSAVLDDPLKISSVTAPLITGGSTPSTCWMAMCEVFFSPEQTNEQCTKHVVVVHWLQTSPVRNSVQGLLVGRVSALHCFFTTSKGSCASFAQWQVPTPSSGMGFRSSSPVSMCTTTASSEAAQPTALLHEVVSFAVAPCFSGFAQECGCFIWLGAACLP